MANNIDYRDKDIDIEGEPSWHRHFRRNDFAHFVDEIRSIKRQLWLLFASIVGGAIAVIINIMCRGW